MRNFSIAAMVLHSTLSFAAPSPSVSLPGPADYSRVSQCYRLLEKSGLPNSKLEDILAFGNEYGSLSPSNAPTVQAELQWLYGLALNPRFKISLLKWASKNKISIVEEPEQEMLSNVRMELAKLLETLPADDINTFVVHELAVIGTSQDIKSLERVYDLVGNYGKHLALSAIEEIKARTDGINFGSIWQKSPISNEIRLLYFENDDITAAMKHFDTHFKYFTRNDINFILEKTHMEKPELAILVLGTNVFNDNFTASPQVISSLLTWLRSKIDVAIKILEGRIISSLGVRSLEVYPSQLQFEFLAKYGDSKDLAGLRTLRLKSLDGSIEILSSNTIRALLKRP